MKKTSIYSGKKVVLMGLGRSAVALAKLLHSRGAKVSVSEIKPKDNLQNAIKDLAEIENEMEMEFGRHSSAVFQDADYVVVAPGIPLDTKPLDEVAQKNIPILSDIDMVMSEVDVPVVAVVGSHGKTTVAALIAAFLKNAGKKAFLCGDHGEPMANYLLQEEKADFIILELSAYQLDHLKSVTPKISILTNLEPPLPARYSKPDDYARNIYQMLKRMNNAGVVIYNFREASFRALIPHLQVQKRIFRKKDPVSLGAEIASRYKGTYMQNAREMVWTDSQKKEVYDLRNLQIFGPHNRENLMAAIIAARDLGVEQVHIQKVIDTFPGVPHRLELVRKRGGVRFINDSKTTGVHGLRVALEAFPLDPIILIAGGKDNQADFGELVELVKEKVKTMILVGEAKEHINRSVGDFSETFLVGTFEEAILLSFQKSRDGDIILLSPACESYDMFVDYEERGNFFKRYIQEF